MKHDKKKPYAKPLIISEDMLESKSLACMKIPGLGMGSQCDTLGPSTS